MLTKGAYSFFKHTHIYTLQTNMYNIVLHVPFIQAAKRCKYLVQPGCLKSYCDGLIAIGSSYSIKPHRFWSPEKLNIWVLIQLCIEGIGRISHIVLISSDILWWYVSWWWISNGYQLIVFSITSDFWASLVGSKEMMSEIKNNNAIHLLMFELPKIPRFTIEAWQWIR